MLIIGVGKGTKCLQDFLGCTKSYEATMLFGAATDTYDTKGKVLGRAGYGHVTRDGVEKALGAFRGQIMQRPPIFSALRIRGKRLYEYAREGADLPEEIKERPVRVDELEVVAWLEGGKHEYRWPEKEADGEEREVAEKVLHFGNGAVETETAKEEDGKEENTEGVDSKAEIETRKRKLDDADDEDGLVYNIQPPSKRREPDPEIVMSGGLDPSGDATTTMHTTLPPHTESPNPISPLPPSSASHPTDPGPQAVKLRMTVTSGFYVRSLCHDLGKAVGSLGIMSALVRTRQGDFELGKNALDYGDLDQGEEVWGPKVKAMLEGWQRKVGAKKGEEGDGGSDGEDGGTGVCEEGNLDVEAEEREGPGEGRP